MLKVKNFVFANRLIAVIFAMIMLFSVTFAATMYFDEDTTACTFSQKTFYFSDASHSTVVGYSGYLCDGTFVKSGKTSRYTDTLYCDCNEDTK